jgi:hypothetical protein
MNAYITTEYKLDVNELKNAVITVETIKNNVGGRTA